MGKELLVIGIGVLVAILPFLGFPNSLDTVFFVMLGLSITILGTLIRRDALAREAREARRAETYVQTPDYEHAGNSALAEESAEGRAHDA